jgi:hypothetical protein
MSGPGPRAPERELTCSASLTQLYGEGVAAEGLPYRRPEARPGAELRLRACEVVEVISCSC